jgi:hypothetical protein
MFTILLNNTSTAIKLDLEAAAIRSSLMFSESVSCNGATVHTLKLYGLCDKMPLKFLIELWLSFNSDADQQEIDDIWYGYNYYTKMKTKKSKSRQDTLFTDEFRNLIVSLRKECKAHLQNQMNRFNLIELNKFHEDLTIFTIAPQEFYEEAKTDDPMVSIIYNILTGKVFFALIHNLYKAEQGAVIDNYQATDIDISGFPAFLHAPLFELPDLKILEYSDLAYTREKILKQLSKFSEALLQLKETLHGIKYSAENFEAIKDHVQTALLEFPKDFNTQLQDEIYIRKVMKAIPTNYNIRYHLAISSFDYILRFYENMKIVPTYTLLASKQLIEKLHVEGDTTVFFYLELIMPDNA